MASTTPGQPWEQWGCPIKGCVRWVLSPWDLEWHTAAKHPAWPATYQLLRPYPNQRQRVVYRRNAPPSPGSHLEPRRGPPRAAVLSWIAPAPTSGPQSAGAAAVNS